MSNDIESGAALVRALDAAKFPVSAAVWLYRADLEDWRLTIATPRAESLRDAYVEVLRIAEEAHVNWAAVDRIHIVTPTDRTITGLSRSRRLEGLGGVRVAGMVDGVYIEDAYVYRAAA